MIDGGRLKEVQEAMDLINNHVEDVAEKLSEEEVNNFVNTLLGSKRVFLIGAGRSGLIARAFAMRLMHLDLDVHVIGETITPGVEKDDLFIGVSGSGETTLVVSAAKAAREIGAKIAVITSYPDSILGKLADQVVTVPGRVEPAKTRDYMDRQISGKYESLTPLGTLFEATALIFLDGVIAGLMSKMGKKEEDLNRFHATIE
ncbi:6-phospho 3-hexuloisomerase [candidate division MSBL1 archaeon SCGC-AAA261O19]|uniref:6-phospho 3-hexuloisomerase n=2 Tax=candidate division MSBL1 TaxID=215777 RepID=A0A133V2G3_9EURY|nr:6-phospho 3-hexuloisomerase [candidate division MSBL1 archaeon SCGC-AAA261C02]KXB04991.1 6-phospho 3-hexuloisomerase [candidate division MSBL1 archaeon SCGC-AAA261O19]